MQITYGGNDLTKYFKVVDVRRQILPERINYTKEIPSVNGEYYSGYKYGIRTIEVDFAIIGDSKDDYFTKSRQLASMVDVVIPTKLEFSDEPDKYYYAVVDGSIDIEQIINYGAGTISFVCHDPIAYSKEEKIFAASEDNKLTIDNKGTAFTRPLINVCFGQDAHFLQCTYFTGETVLLGTRPDVDKPSVSQSDLVLDEPCEVTTDFTSVGNVLDEGREVMGNCTINQGGYGVVCANYGSSTNGWHGGALKRSIGPNLEEFEIVATMEHNSGGKLGYGSNATDKPANNSVYTCTAEPSLRIRKDRTTNSSKIGSIPKGKDVTVTDISKGWGKVTYGGVTGYSSMDYLSLKQTNKNSYSSDEEPSTENRLGRIELYGFDSNGQKLFKFGLKDSEEWFEYTEPEVYIGNTLVLSDNKSAPKPITEKVQDDNDKTIIKEVDSGRFGDWNDFYGNFKLKRTRLSNGNYQWYAEVNKIKDGKVTNSIKTNTLSSDNYPKGTLNHVVIWFGQYKEVVVVDTMCLTDIKVRRLNQLPNEPVNQKIFKAGEEVIIDCSQHKVYSKDNDYMQHLDIGSEFFDVRDGVSEIRCISDDKSIDVEASIVEKWL